MMIGAYLDCSGGITAKMVLGALLDAGLPHEMLKREIAKLGAAGDFTLETKKVVMTGMPCTKADLRFEATDTARSCMEILELIRSSSLDQRTIGMATKVFEVLAKAEGKVHGCRPEDVHFHEIGKMSNIAAVCASVAFLPRPILASPLPLGSGTIMCSHGMINLPAPATMEIIQEMRLPSYETGIKGELVTPTGAALVAVMASGFSVCPGEKPERTGIGAGDEEDLSVPNVLRLRVFGKQQQSFFLQPVTLNNKGKLRVKEQYHTHELSDGTRINAYMHYDENKNVSNLHLAYSNDDKKTACMAIAITTKDACKQGCGKDNKTCKATCDATYKAAADTCRDATQYPVKEEYSGYKTLSVYDILKLVGYEASS